MFANVGTHYRGKKKKPADDRLFPLAVHSGQNISYFKVFGLLLGLVLWRCPPDKNNYHNKDLGVVSELRL